jgi:hypothetical protein
MRRAAGEVHAAAPEFDEEEYVQPWEPNGIDAERLPCAMPARAKRVLGLTLFAVLQIYSGGTDQQIRRWLPRFTDYLPGRYRA